MLFRSDAARNYAFKLGASAAPELALGIRAPAAPDVVARVLKVAELTRAALDRVEGSVQLVPEDLLQLLARMADRTVVLVPCEVPRVAQLRTQLASIVLELLAPARPELRLI